MKNRITVIAVAALLLPLVCAAEGPPVLTLRGTAWSLDGANGAESDVPDGRYFASVSLYGGETDETALWQKTVTVDMGNASFSETTRLCL